MPRWNYYALLETHVPVRFALSPSLSWWFYNMTTMTTAISTTMRDVRDRAGEDDRGRGGSLTNGRGSRRDGCFFFPYPLLLLLIFVAYGCHTISS